VTRAIRLTRRLLPGLFLPAVASAQGRRMRPGAGPTLGPERANGVVVWVHQHYADGSPPDPPDFLARLTGDSWDLWRLDREAPATGFAPGMDPLADGAEALAAGTARLRAEGYRRIAVVGVSRGAFIILVALRHAPLAEAALWFAPAAHGQRPERRAEALAAFREACEAARPGAVRRGGVVLFAGDGYDPDPPARAAAFAGAMARCGAEALVIDRPAAPTGHGGADDPAMDAIFGTRLAGFLGG